MGTPLVTSTSWGNPHVEAGPPPPRTNPEATAGIFSRLTFSWLNEVVQKGYKKPLEAEDLWVLSRKDRSQELSRRFLTAWGREMAVPDKKKRSLLRAIRRVWGCQFAVGGVVKLLNDASQFVGPVFLSQFIGFVSDRSVPAWHGWVFAFAIFASFVLAPPVAPPKNLVD